MNRFSASFLALLSQEAKKSFRHRQHHNLHTSYSDKCQRLINILGGESYIQPHRHSADPKLETLVAIQGFFCLIKFDDEGAIIQITSFGSQQFISQSCDAYGVEIDPQEWHTIIAMTPSATLLEIKEGPFDSNIAKELAPWAPKEGSQEANQYFEGLKIRAQDSLVNS